MEWIDVVVKMVFLVASTAVTLYLVPWLKEKQLYGTVVKCVQAAEKYAKTHNIDQMKHAKEELQNHLINR